VHLVGSNGEQARHYYKPKKLPDALYEALPAALFRPYWFARCERRRPHFKAWTGLLEGGALESWRMAKALPRPGARGLAGRLSEYYTRERVRHFIGNGLALYASAGLVRAPMLDGKVVEAFRGMDQAERRDDGFHRRAIAAMVPELASVPYNAPLDGGARRVGYSPYAKVLALDAVKDVILQCPKLDEVLAPAKRELLLARSNPACVELLLTLAYAAQVATQHGL
jgi:hypothetical protein